MLSTQAASNCSSYIRIHRFSFYAENPTLIYNLLYEVAAADGNVFQTAEVGFLISKKVHFPPVSRLIDSPSNRWGRGKCHMMRLCIWRTSSLCGASITLKCWYHTHEVWAKNCVRPLSYVTEKMRALACVYVCVCLFLFFVCLFFQVHKSCVCS